jgi:hypothetical protein
MARLLATKGISGFLKKGEEEYQNLFTFSLVTVLLHFQVYFLLFCTSSSFHHASISLPLRSYFLLRVIC